MAIRLIDVASLPDRDWIAPPAVAVVAPPAVAVVAPPAVAVVRIAYRVTDNRRDPVRDRLPPAPRGAATAATLASATAAADKAADRLQGRGASETAHNLPRMPRVILPRAAVAVGMSDYVGTTDRRIADLPAPAWLASTVPAPRKAADPVDVVTVAPPLDAANAVITVAPYVPIGAWYATDWQAVAAVASVRGALADRDLAKRKAQAAVAALRAYARAKSLESYGHTDAVATLLPVDHSKLSAAVAAALHAVNAGKGGAVAAATVAAEYKAAADEKAAAVVAVAMDAIDTLQAIKAADRALDAATADKAAAVATLREAVASDAIGKCPIVAKSIRTLTLLRADLDRAIAQREIAIARSDRRNLDRKIHALRMDIAAAERHAAYAANIAAEYGPQTRTGSTILADIGERADPWHV